MKTKLLNLEYKAKSNVLYAAWTESTNGAQWEEMQEAFGEYVDLIERYHVGHVLVDEQHLKYVWIPENQAWLDANITSRLVSGGVKKIAIVLTHIAAILFQTPEIHHSDFFEEDQGATRIFSGARGFVYNRAIGRSGKPSLWVRCIA